MFWLNVGVEVYIYEYIVIVYIDLKFGMSYESKEC